MGKTDKALKKKKKKDKKPKSGGILVVDVTGPGPAMINDMRLQVKAVNLAHEVVFNTPNGEVRVTPVKGVPHWFLGGKRINPQLLNNLFCGTDLTDSYEKYGMVNPSKEDPEVADLYQRDYKAKAFKKLLPAHFPKEQIKALKIALGTKKKQKRIEGMEVASLLKIHTKYTSFDVDDFLTELSGLQTKK